MANYTLLIQALFFIDLFSCTRCPIARTSGAPLSRVITGLSSLVPEPLHSTWHSSVSRAPHPCLWSHPRDSLLSWNLQCISSGKPAVWNDAAEGSSVIKLHCVCEGAVSSDSTCPPLGGGIDWERTEVERVGCKRSDNITKNSANKKGNEPFHPYIQWLL